MRRHAAKINLQRGLFGVFQVALLESMIWVNYNDLTATSLEIMVNKGNQTKKQMALIQVSEILSFSQND